MHLVIRFREYIIWKRRKVSKANEKSESMRRNQQKKSYGNDEKCHKQMKKAKETGTTS